METNLRQGSSEWQEFRSRPDVLSSSDFGAICGVNPKGWSTRLDIWKEKVLKEKRERGEYVTIHFLNYGIVYEPQAIEACQEILRREYGIDDLRKPGIYTHEKYDWLVSSPDLISESHDCVCELKCPNSMSDMIVDPKPEIPIAYMCQVQGQLEICKKSKCFFLVWSPAICVLYEIKRNPEFWDNMFGRLKEFHELVRTSLSDPNPEYTNKKSKQVDKLVRLNVVKKMGHYIGPVDFMKIEKTDYRKLIPKRVFTEIEKDENQSEDLN